MLRPLTELSNEEKARLLHKLMPKEIRQLLGYMEATAQHIIRYEEEIKANWTSTRIPISVWLKLAHDAVGRIDQYRHELSADADFFASQLFTGYLGLFSLTCLREYLLICPNLRFRHGVRFLFDIEKEVSYPGDEPPPGLKPAEAKSRFKKLIEFLKRLWSRFNTAAASSRDIELVIIRRHMPGGTPHNKVWLRGELNSILFDLFDLCGAHWEPTALGRQFGARIYRDGSRIDITHPHRLKDLVKALRIRHITYMRTYVRNA